MAAVPEQVEVARELRRAVQDPRHLPDDDSVGSCAMQGREQRKGIETDGVIAGRGAHHVVRVAMRHTHRRPSAGHDRQRSHRRPQPSTGHVIHAGDHSPILKHHFSACLIA